jgi:hypothetical protein
MCARFASRSQSPVFQLWLAQRIERAPLARVSGDLT